MNDKVKRELEKLKEIADYISDNIECVLSDIEDVESDDDLFIIESGFDRIKQKAVEGYEKTRSLYDEFDD